MALFPIAKQGDKIIINMQREVLTGNVLDIGSENSGIIYNIYKHYNDEASLEYLSGKEEKGDIEKNSYDTCILLFSLRNIWLKVNKQRCVKDIYDFLKDNGVIYIWDIDKPFSKVFKSNIQVLLPEDKVKILNITELNIFKNTSKESIMGLLKDYFEIIDFKCSDNIYYIKAQKKGSKLNETSISRDKFKIRSQQFSHKIFKSIHR